MSRAKNPMIATVFLMLALTASLISQPRASAIEAAAKPYPNAVVSWAGSYCRIEQVELRRITTADDWKSLWQRHHGEDIEKDSYGEAVVPAIDFDYFMVIAIYGGKAVNTRSEGIEAIDDFGDHVRIRFDARTYQTASFPRIVTANPGETAAQAADRIAREAMDEARFDARNNTTPYGIFVIPRSTKTIVMEENVQGLIGHPPIWKERVRFEKLSK